VAFALRQSVVIAAPTEVVWDVICDLSRYGEWNPFVVAAQSTLQVDDPIVMRVRIFDAFKQSQRETIFEHIPQERLCYGLRGRAIRSHRCHLLRPLDDDRCEYTSDFELAGPLSHLTRALLGSRLERGFREMTDALALRAEALQRG